MTASDTDRDMLCTKGIHKVIERGEGIELREGQAAAVGRCCYTGKCYTIQCCDTLVVMGFSDTPQGSLEFAPRIKI